jgi:hypothetical protein
LLQPTSERGGHDIDHPFAFASNPQFIFHDSPGFETGDKSQLEKVQSFIEKCARSTEVDNQLHAIWYCFIPDKARFLLDLEKRFFNEERAGNVPIIAIFTKFDDLIIQVYDERLEEDENREAADRLLKENLRAPLFEYKFPPRADVCLEDMHDDEGDHQEQVKELIKKTADSLDDLALKILFVSLQQNNLELCLQYAVKYAPDLGVPIDMGKLVKMCLIWFRHSHYDSYDYGKTEEGGLGGGRLGGRLGHLRLGLGGRGGGLGHLRLLKNSQKVATLMRDMSDKPYLTVFAALVICLENSFWYHSASVSFIDAFRQAFEIYTEIAMQKVEIALKELGDWSESTAFKSALSETLLNNRLYHPDNVKPSN